MPDDKFFDTINNGSETSLAHRLTSGNDHTQKYNKSSEQHIFNTENASWKDPETGNYISTTNVFDISSVLPDIMHASNIYSPDEIHDMRFCRFARYGMLDMANENSGAREYLFFSKPDLHLFHPGLGFSTSIPEEGNSFLNSELKDVTFFANAIRQYPFSLLSLQTTYTGGNFPVGFDRNNKFMTALSNHVTSSLDLPDITATETQNNTNLFQVTTTYRDGSEASDYGFDFSLEFWDTRYLDIYMIFKAYDEYCRQEFMRPITPVKLSYIEEKINAKQFSIWKIIVDETNTIMYYAKVTGVYPMGVPRSAISNLDGTIKITVPFKGQFVRDMDPIILADLNHLTERSTGLSQSDIAKGTHFLPLYNSGNSSLSSVRGADTTWAKYPYIITKGKRHGADNKEGELFKLVWLA